MSPWYDVTWAYFVAAQHHPAARGRQVGQEQHGRPPPRQGKENSQGSLTI